VNSFSESPVIRVWGIGKPEDQAQYDYSFLLPDPPGTYSDLANPLRVANDGIDDRRCYGDVEDDTVENNDKKCGTITFATLTPLDVNEYTVNVADGTYYEARIGFSSKTWNFKGTSRDGTKLYLGHSYTHVIECSGSGSLLIEKFTISFYPIKDIWINMIRFQSESGSFTLTDCVVKGHMVALSSNTFVAGPSLSISNCDYSDIEVNGSDTGAAIHSEIPAGEEFIVEHCTFTNCKQTKGDGSSQGGAIMAFGSDPGSYGSAGAGTLIVKDCAFTRCYAGNDGGSVCVRGPAASFEDCRFVESTGRHWGGAISVIFRYSYNFTRCIFLQCKSINDSTVAGNGGAVNIWDELTGVGLSPSFEFNHCYFEGNDAYNNNATDNNPDEYEESRDVSLTLSGNHFASVESSFIHSVSRTRRTGDSPKLVLRKADLTVYNDLVPYSHGVVLYAGTSHKDIEYCGCADYHCRTLEYTYGRFEYFFFFFLIYLFNCLCYLIGY
jgi:hypothetical protein